MDELDESWAQMLIAAGEKAALDGRHEVAEYLRLKATNDAIRAAGVKWLLDTFVETAFEPGFPSMLIERVEGHTFRHGSSTMAGSLVTFRLGVRCLTVEAGWTRLPSHGIMRGSALARANIVHFGRSRDDQALKLVHCEPLPEWLDENGASLRLDDVRRHIGLLLGR